MQILITGFHGFVGSNLVCKLSMGNRIYGLSTKKDHSDSIIQSFSWNQLKEIPDVDVIIHSAGKAHDTKKSTETQEYFEINTELTQIIYDHFRSSKAKKFIFFSTVKAVADTVSESALTEKVIPAPKGPYGESKIAAENYILSNPVNDKKVYILRPCMIHGPGNKGNLNSLFNLIKRKIPWPLGAFENQRSFTSIDNLCYAVDSLINKDIPAGIYNIADDNPLSTNELILLMAESMETKVQIWRWNCSFIKGCSKMGTFLHLPLNSERLQKLTQNYVVSNEKLKNALGIEKMPVNARDGMIKTFSSIK